MALAYRTSTQSALGTSNPTTLSVTVNSGDALLVIGIVGANTTARTGGAPTRGAQTAIQIGSTVVGEAECTAELWYIASPATGTADVSVPNSGGLSIRVMAHLFTGTGAALFNSNSTNTSVDDPSLTITSVPAGSAVIDVFASGHKDVSSASDTGIYANDEGAWCSHAQYVNHASLGDEVFTWTTVALDDVAFIMAAFQESSTTPLEQPGTDSNTSNWNDAAQIALSLSASDNNGSNWSDGVDRVSGLFVAASETNASNWSDVSHGILYSDLSWQDAVEEQHPATGGELTPLTQPCEDTNTSNWNDAVQWEIGLSCSDSNQSNWNDVAALHIGLSASDSNQSNWNDATRSAFSLNASDSNQSNWNDTSTLGRGIILSDSNQSNWNDALQSAFSLNASDSNQSNWSDSTALHIGLSASDSNQSNWSDGLQIALGLSASDDAQNWNDACATFLGVFVNQSDTGASNWSDSIQSAFSLSTSDSNASNWSDSTQLYFTQAISDDAANWSDDVAEQHPTEGPTPLNQPCEDTNASDWNDVCALAMSLAYADADLLNQWQEALPILSTQGLLVETDDLQYWNDACDRLMCLFRDGIGSGNQGNWNDDLTKFSLWSIVKADDLANWQDASAKIQASNKNLTDRNFDETGGTPNLNDMEWAGPIAHGLLPADTQTITDAEAHGFINRVDQADTFALSDAITIHIGLLAADTQSLSDAHEETTGTGAAFVESLTQTDSLHGYEYANWADEPITDVQTIGIIPLYQPCEDSNESNWNDTETQTAALSHDCTDSNESNWTDESHGWFTPSGMGWGDDSSQQVVILISQSDSNESNWNDTQALTSAGSYAGSDSNESNWNDARTLASAMSLGQDDGLTFTDDIGNQRGYRLAQSDSNESNWNDERALTGTGACAQADTLTLLDADARVYGYLCAQGDAITATDAHAEASAQSLAQADLLNYQNDAQVVFAPSFLAQSDTLTMSDECATEVTTLVQEKTIDQSDALAMDDAPSILQTQARFAGDDAANWQDGQASIANLLKPDFDSFSVTDGLAASAVSSLSPSDQFTFDDGQDGFTEYGYGVGDDLDWWYDEITIPTTGEIGKDDDLNLWTDEWSAFSPWSGVFEDAISLADAVDVRLYQWVTTTDANLQADSWAVASAASLAQADQSVLADACACALGLACVDGLAFEDQPTVIPTVLIPKTDSLNLSDNHTETAVGHASLNDSNQTNWSDSHDKFMPIGLDLGGENIGFLSDAENLYSVSQAAIDDSGAVNWLDTSDRGMTLSRVLASDGGANWLDISASVSVNGHAIADNLAAWGDDILRFAPASTAQGDTITLTDGFAGSGAAWIAQGDQNAPSDGYVVGLGCGIGQDDTFIFTDTQNGFSQYGYADSDSLDNWLDDYTIPAVGTIDKSDSFELTDQYDAGMTQARANADAGESTDAPAIGYGLNGADSESLTDACAYTIGLMLTLDDADTTWADASTRFAASGLVQEDACPVPSDTCRVIEGLLKPDEADGNWGNWQDGLTRFATQNYADADNAANWNDTKLVGYGIGSDDQIILSDAPTVQRSAGLYDGFTLTDSTELAFGLAGADAITQADSLHGYLFASWNDALVLDIGGITQLPVEGEDGLTFTDSATLSLGQALTVGDGAVDWADGQASVQNAYLTGSDSLLSEDAFATSIASSLALADQQTLTDAVAQFSNQFFDLADFYQFSDQFLTGQTLPGELADAFAEWSDAISFATGFGVVGEDAFECSDALAAMLGVFVVQTDGFVLTDWFMRSGENPMDLGDALTLQDSFVINFNRGLCRIVALYGADPTPVELRCTREIQLAAPVIRSVRLHGPNPNPVQLKHGGDDPVSLRSCRIA